MKRNRSPIGRLWWLVLSSSLFLVVAAAPGPDLRAVAEAWAEAAKASATAAIQATAAYAKAMNEYSKSMPQDKVAAAHAEKAANTLAQLKAAVEDDYNGPEGSGGSGTGGSSGGGCTEGCKPPPPPR